MIQKKPKMNNDEFGLWFNEYCIKNEFGRVALEKMVMESGFDKKIVRESMERLGYKYNKDLSKLGQNEFKKPYKGGYEGLEYVVKNDEDD
jgi:hypothetical protein